MTPPCRVDKLLRDSTDCSLAELRVACGAGRVRIARVREPASSSLAAQHGISPSELVFEGDVVELDGQRVIRRTRFDYLALHKPVGVTTTARDPDGHADLSPWLANMPDGVFPVGRLDRDTSGLLLCTNDGDFAHAMLHPAHHVEKSYRLQIGARLDAADPRIAALQQGVAVAGERTPLRATSVTLGDRSEQHTELVVCLREGKHRQLRKMCHALHLHLIELHRFAIGLVELAGLDPGASRTLTDDEIEGLWSLAGGRSLVQQRQLAALERQARAARDAGSALLRLERWLQVHAPSA